MTWKWILIPISLIVLGLIAWKTGAIQVRRTCPYSRSAKFRELQRRLQEDSETSDGWL